MIRFGNRFVDDVYQIEFIVFERDDTSCPQDMHFDRKPVDHLFTRFLYGMIIYREIGFALCRIRDNVFDLRTVGRRKFHIGRKRRASHTDDARVPDAIERIFRIARKRIERTHIRRLIASIRFDRNTGNLRAACHSVRRDLCYRPRDRRMYGNGHVFVGGSDNLPFDNAVADVYGTFVRRTAHRDGDRHSLRGRKRILDGPVASVCLPLRRIDSAFKCKHTHSRYCMIFFRNGQTVNGTL